MGAEVVVVTRALLMLSLVMFSLSAHAGAEQACMHETADEYKPYTDSDVDQSPDRQRGVSYDRAEARRNGITYPLDVYVGYSPDKAQSNRYCMRFEIHNPGNKKVEGIRWPFAKLKFGALSEKGGVDDRRAVIANPSSDPEPFLYESEIRIFENEPGKVTSYMPAVKTPAPPQQAQEMLKPKIYTLGQLDAAIANSIQFVSEKQPERAILTYEGVGIPTSEFQAASLTQRLHTDGILLTTKSSVRPTSDGRVQIVNEIEVEGAGEIRRVAAPYLMTLFKYDVNDAGSFGEIYPAAVDFFESVRETWLSVSDKKPFVASATYDRSSGWIDSLAIVDHPVAIETTLGVDCMLVPAYAPAPFAFSLDDCPADQ